MHKGLQFLSLKDPPIFKPWILDVHLSILYFSHFLSGKWEQWQQAALWRLEYNTNSFFLSPLYI